jgi:hypothetical protein
VLKFAGKITAEFPNLEHGDHQGFDRKRFPAFPAALGKDRSFSG